MSPAVRLLMRNLTCYLGERRRRGKGLGIRCRKACRWCSRFSKNFCLRIIWLQEVFFSNELPQSCSSVYRNVNQSNAVLKLHHLSHI